MDTVIQSLRALLHRDQVISDSEELLVYECDGLTHYKHRPRAVIFPRSTTEVSDVMRLLAREGVSFAPRGAGTGLSGGALAVGGGVQIELSRMRRILKVDVENRLAVVETGLVNAQLSRAVARHGLHYAPDPSSQGACTIGGNIAENAGGIHCLKYGTTVDHILGARVVLSDGSIVDIGGSGVETAGYDLLGVFVGSEGTFGIATEATLRLTPVAPSVRTLLADFTDIDDASRAVSAIIAAGFIPAALEMVDGATIRAVEASVFAAGLPIDAEAALLVELDGLDAGLDDEAAHVESICRGNGARSVRHAADEIERKKLWAARKGAFGAMGRIMPDMMLQDAVVPRSRLPEVLAGTYRIASKYNLRLANVFHAGDGNLHPIMCYDSRDHDEVARVREAGREIVETCVRAGGTITGEHGVGLDKSDYLPLVFSEETLRAMLQVRRAFDPSGLCNPGKVIPVLRGCGEARSVVERKSSSPAERQEFESNPNGEQEPSVTPADRVASTAVVRPSPPNIVRTDHLHHALSAIVGKPNVSVDELAPGEHHAYPTSAEEIGEILRLTSSEGWKVLASGAATHPSKPAADVVIKTTRMTRVVEHQPADLVATAEAGATLVDFNQILRDAGQWLPLDPPDDGRATLGGVAATGLCGAQSFGYGLPRSKVLGMQVALADGNLIRVGGRVVKNVAGYDLSKLFVGSYGTLGVITELTFKLRPRPECERTLAVYSKESKFLLEVARAVIATPLFPVAAELLSLKAANLIGMTDSDALVLMLRFAGTEATVLYQLARAREMVRQQAPDANCDVVVDDSRLWTKLAALPLSSEYEFICRLSVLPGALDSVLDEVCANERASGDVWHAGAGDGRARIMLSADSLADADTRIERLEHHVIKLGGRLFVERRPTKSGGRVEQASSTAVMQRVKEQLDPAGTFPP